VGTLAASQNQYGAHWDAPHYLVASDRIAGLLDRHWGDENGGAPLPFPSDIDYYFPLGDRHPPLVKVLGGVTAFLFRDSLGTLGSLRISIALLSGLLGGALFLFLRRPLGAWYAVAAVFLWIAIPRVFAHGHFFALDQPVALFYFASLGAFYALHQRWFALAAPPASRRIALPAALTAVFLALGFLTKHQAHFVIPVVLVWSLVESRIGGSRGTKRLAGWILVVGAIGASAAALFLAGWPALWHDPGTRLKQYVAFLTEHGQVPVIYFGRRYPPGSPSWHFPFVMWLLTVPAWSLVLFVLGCCLPLPANCRRMRRFLLFGAAAPFLFLVLPGVARFDGVRHLMPAAPFYAAVAALGLREAAARVGRSTARIVRTFGARAWEAAAAAVLLLLSCSPVISSHPFQHVFYNSLVGGLPGAERIGLEADYLGISTKGLFPHLNRVLNDGDVLFVAGMNPQVLHPAFHEPWRNARAGDILIPKVRVCSIEMAGTLVRAAGRPFLLANFRRSDDPSELAALVQGHAPLAAMEWNGVRLGAVYPLEWEPGLPLEPIHVEGPAALLEARQPPDSAQWTALWKCRTDTAEDWGITWQWRDAAGKSIEGGFETQIVPICAARYWLPGDVYRASYPRAGSFRGGSLFLAVWAHSAGQPPEALLLPVPVTRPQPDD